MVKDKKIQTKTEEREYIIPLKREWRKVANYRRAGRAAKFIKKFIAKHMKIPDRDATKVKIDQYLNNEIWFRGRKKPPTKIKIRAIKYLDTNIVKVELAEFPAHIKFLKQKQEKIHKEVEKPKESEKKEEPEKKETEEEKEEKKEAEKEKSHAVAEQRTKQAETQAKAEKHLTKVKEPKIHRMALKK